MSVGDLAVVLGENVYEGLNCLQAWGEFGAGHLTEILNSVRNRILDFSIALWKEDPLAGDPRSKTSAIEPSTISHIFNTTVYGGSANLIGAAIQSEVSMQSTVGDLEALRTTLRQAGVSDSDIDDLTDTLQEEPEPTVGTGFGPKVSSWIARMVERAASGSWKIGIGAAGTLLAQAIGRYYGLSP